MVGSSSKLTQTGTKQEKNIKFDGDYFQLWGTHT